MVLDWIPGYSEEKHNSSSAGQDGSHDCQNSQGRKQCNRGNNVFTRVADNNYYRTNRVRAFLQQIWYWKLEYNLEIGWLE